MIRLLIADDHAVVRKGLKRVISTAGDIQVTDEAASGPELLEKIRQQHFDLLLLDLSFGQTSGLDILRALRQQSIRVPVLIVSMHPEEMLAVRALRAGADGYLTKDAPTDLLLSVIRKLAVGGRYVSPTVEDQLAANLKAAEKLPHERLSNREYQVLCLITAGRKLTEIAQALGVSAKTISAYRVRILEKMQLKTTSELIYYGVTNGLLARSPA
jgi:two-component system invasion response regulator UvrY